MTPATVKNGKFVHGTKFYYISSRDAVLKETNQWVSATTGAITLAASNTSDNEKWAIIGNATDGYQFVNRSTGQYVQSNNGGVTDTSNNDLFVSNGLAMVDASGEQTVFDMTVAKTNGYFVIAAHDFQDHHFTWSRNGNNGNLGAWYSAAGWNYVGWKANNNGDNGCMFQFSEAETLEVPFHEALITALANGNTVYNQCFDNEVRSGALITAASQFDNTCGDSQQGTDPGVLINGSTSDLWHSDWHNRVTGDHYLGVTMPEDCDYTVFDVEVTPRGDQTEKQERPTIIKVYGYKDGAWTSSEIATFTTADGLGGTTTATLRLDTEGVVYEKFKFEVTETWFNGSTTTTRHFFALSEFQMYGVSCKLYDVPQTLTDNLQSAINAGQTAFDEYNTEDFEACITAINDAIAAIQNYEPITPSDIDNLRARIDATMWCVTSGVVGYPNPESSANYDAIAALYVYASDEIVTAENYNDALAALHAVQNLTDINLPQSGKAYTFTAYFDNGKKYYLKYEDAGLRPVLKVGTDELPQEAHFIARDLGNGRFLFVTEDGKHIAWRGASAGTNSNKGYTDYWDETNSPLLIQRMTPYETQQADTSNKTVADFFGYVTVAGKRDGVDVCFVVDKYQENNPSFNQDNSYHPRYDNRYSTAFYIEEVDNANIVKITNPNPTGNSSLDGKFVGTFSATYNVELPENVKAYKGAVDGDIVQFTEIGKIVPRNTGVFLYSADATEKIEDLAIPAATNSMPNMDDNVLMPTGRTGLALPENSLVLGKGNNGVGFYKINPDKNFVGRNKAYIPVGSASSVSRYVFDFEEGTTTNIGGFDNVPAESNLYDLQGRRVMNAQKGLYIVNGKKVVR